MEILKKDVGDVKRKMGEHEVRIGALESQVPLQQKAIDRLTDKMDTVSTTLTDIKVILANQQGATRSAIFISSGIVSFGLAIAAIIFN